MWEKSKQILNLSMLLFKKLGVLKHAESKFKASIVRSRGFGHFFVQTLDFSSSFHPQTRQSDFPEYTPLFCFDSALMAEHISNWI